MRRIANCSNYEFPQEIRLLIWEQALPGPRIIWLERAHLDVEFKDRPDLSDSDSDSESESEFMSSDPGSDREMELEYESQYGVPERGGFRCRNPRIDSVQTLALVCRDSREVVEKFYAKAFRTKFAYRETWFDFEFDTLYLDWGRESNGVAFSAIDLGNDARNVKHLALYQPHDDYYFLERGAYEEFLCETLLEFRNLEILTLVNKRHDYETDRLVFMEPAANLLVWERCRKDNTIPIKLPDLDRCIEEWLDFDTGDSPITLDEDKLERFRTQWKEHRIPPWKMPSIRRKVITIESVKVMLETIAGGADVRNLATLSLNWLKNITGDPPIAFDSAKFSEEKQRLYLEMLVTFVPQ